MNTAGERQRRDMGRTASADPRVTVVVPVLNGERYLAESLDSILNQTYLNVEVIVLDDASTDATAEIVASYGGAVDYHRQAKTRGIYGNANEGIARATGQLVCVYHADDVYLPTIVEREVEFLSGHPDVGAVFAADIFIDEDGREFGRLVLPPEVRGDRPLAYRDVVNTLLTYQNTFLRCPSAMVRMSVHEDVGVYRDDEFKNTSDLEMWLRIARRYSIAVLEEPLYLYRRGHGSSSERYHHLRTNPGRFFRIMDLELENGGAEVATPDALETYEAHRSADLLMVAISNYIKSSCSEARRALAAVDSQAIRRSPRVQRIRLLALFGLLSLLVRIPRLRPIAGLFRRRWHGTVKRAAAGAP